MNLLFLDIETTGLDPVKNRPIEIAAKFVPDKEIDDMSAKALRFKAVILFKATEETPVSIGAMSVNGRSPNESRYNSADDVFSTEEAAIEKFANWLAAMKYRFRDFIVTGHNVHFDIAFLKEAFKRNNYTDIESVIGYRYLDVASIALFCMYSGILRGLSKPSNEEMIKFFNLGKMFSTLHTATMDIQATEANLRRIVEIVKPGIPYMQSVGTENGTA